MKSADKSGSVHKLTFLSLSLFLFKMMMDELRFKSKYWLFFFNIKITNFCWHDWHIQAGKVTLKAGKICEKQHGTSDQTSFLFYQKLQKINATIAKKNISCFEMNFPRKFFQFLVIFWNSTHFFFKKKILKIFCLILNDSPSFLELIFFCTILKHICLLTAQLMIQITAKKSFKRRDKSGI